MKSDERLMRYEVSGDGMKKKKKFNVYITILTVRKIAGEKLKTDIHSIKKNHSLTQARIR